MALADMGVAVDRIMKAIAAKERITVHGDYDVDGVTSTVILRRALELLLEADDLDAASDMADRIARFLNNFGLLRERDELRRHVAKPPLPPTLDPPAP